MKCTKNIPLSTGRVQLNRLLKNKTNEEEEENVLKKNANRLIYHKSINVAF